MYATGSRRIRLRTISPIFRAAAAGTLLAATSEQRRRFSPVAERASRSSRRARPVDPRCTQGIGRGAQRLGDRAGRDGRSRRWCGLGRLGLETRPLLLGGEHLGDFREVAGEHGLELVHGQLDAVVGTRFWGKL